MFIQSIGVVVLTAALAACSGGSGSSGSINPGSGADYDRSLLGTVTNPNGVRDDVNAKLIEKYSATPAILNAAVTLARVEQDALRMTDSGIAPTQADFTRMNYAIACLGNATPSLMSLETTSNEILAMIYNTPERLRAHSAFDKKLDGFRLYLPKVADPCTAAK